MSETKTKIIIDCDPGTDDAFALLLASVQLRERLAGLLSCYGNSTLANTHANLVGLRGLLSLDSVPVYRGSACPMGKSAFVPTDYHGSDGLCGVVLPRTSPLADEEALEAVYDLIRREGKVIYLVLGPLTNLARLLLRHSDCAEMLEAAVIMGGGLGLGNTASGAEYNFSLDPAACDMVLRSPVKKVLVPLNLTHTLAFDEKEMGEMAGKGSGEAHGIFLELFRRNYASAIREGHGGAVIHDAATAAFLCDPTACEVREMLLWCDGAGRLHEGEAGQAVSVLTRMSKAFMKGLLAEAFRIIAE